MYVLTASQSYQAAPELSAIGHGYLTFALIEEDLRAGLADHEPSDGKITIREWFDYAVARVPRLDRELESRTRALVLATTRVDDQLDTKRMRFQTPPAFYPREEVESLVISNIKASELH